MNRSRRLTALSLLVCGLAVLELLLVAGCGKPLTEEQKRAILKVQERGGRVNYRGTGFEVAFTGTEVADDDLKQLKSVGNVKILDLRGTQITDTGVVHLAELTTLETIKLQGSKITHEGIAKLRKALPNTLINQ